MKCFCEFDLGQNYPFFLSVFDDVKKSDDWNIFCDLVKKEPERWLLMNDYGYKSESPNWFEWKFDVHDVYMRLKNSEAKFLKLKFGPKYESWNWLTLSPRPMLKSDQLDDFEEFVNGIFSDKLMDEFYWVIECGKNSDKPNYHMHALYRFKNHNVGKNFKRDVVRKFDKVFKCEKGIDWTSDKGKGWFLKKFQGKNIDPKIIQDKIDYCVNTKKSYLHENFMDLGLSGSWKAGKGH